MVGLSGGGTTAARTTKAGGYRCHIGRHQHARLTRLSDHMHNHAQ